MRSGAIRPRRRDGRRRERRMPRPARPGKTHLRQPQQCSSASRCEEDRVLAEPQDRRAGKLHESAPAGISGRPCVFGTTARTPPAAVRQEAIRRALLLDPTATSISPASTTPPTATAVTPVVAVAPALRLLLRRSHSRWRTPSVHAQPQRRRRPPHPGRRRRRDGHRLHRARRRGEDRGRDRLDPAAKAASS